MVRPERLNSYLPRELLSLRNANELTMILL